MNSQIHQYANDVRTQLAALKTSIHQINDHVITFHEKAVAAGKLASPEMGALEQIKNETNELAGKIAGLVLHPVPDVAQPHAVAGVAVSEAPAVDAEVRRVKAAGTAAESATERETHAKHGHGRHAHAAAK